MTVLEKIRCLENYVAINNSGVDSVVEVTINKLLAREYVRMSEVKSRLIRDIAKFEKQYDLDSEDFYRRYEAGEVGDKMDFVEWAATIEMLAGLNQQIALLPTHHTECGCNPVHECHAIHPNHDARPARIHSRQETPHAPHCC